MPAISRPSQKNLVADRGYLSDLMKTKEDFDFINNPNQSKKRFLQEQIDLIYHHELIRLENDIAALQKQISEWAVSKKESCPDNIESKFIRMQEEKELEMLRKEKESLINRKFEFKAESDIQKLIREYKIRLSNQFQEEPFGQQVNNFCTSENAFTNFKHSPNIQVTISKFNDQLKLSTGFQINQKVSDIDRAAFMKQSMADLRNLLTDNKHKQK